MQIMGILNITPDSFFDGSLYASPERALERALKMQAEGADIIDLGAQSTRPGSAVIAAEEELARLLPVLDKLAGRIEVPISVDTFYPEVAKAVLMRGASLINDVSGKVTPEMASVIMGFGANWILMHNPGGADIAEHYAPDVVSCVKDKLTNMVRQALVLGVAKDKLCIDPGIGFGKSRADNLKLLANTNMLKIEGVELLIGASRKRLIGEQYTPEERLAGTIAAHVIAQLGGANMIRVHDVKEAVQAARFVKECY